MTSLEVKDRMLRYLTAWSNSRYMGAVVEAANLWHADVLGVKYNGRISEFEIKLSPAPTFSVR